MATAGLTCTPPPLRAPLPPIRTSFLTPATTAQLVSYRSVPLSASTEPRFDTVRRLETTTHGTQELGRRGGKGWIDQLPDVDMDGRAGDRHVEKETSRFAAVASPGDEAEDEVDSPSVYSDDDSTQGSQYSDEDEDSERDPELPTTFSDPGHYTYTEQARPDGKPMFIASGTARVGDSFNPAPPTLLQHARPTAPSPLSARVGRPVLQLKPKVQFVFGESGTHGAPQESTPTSLIPPLQPAIHTPPLGAYFNIKPPARTSMKEKRPLPPTPRHRYASSDPGHTFVAPPSPETEAPIPSTKARTMPGYRTAHTPPPARAYRDTRPNNLDAIIESSNSLNNPYGHVYTGIPTPHDEDVGEVRQGIAFPRWGSRSTIAVGQASTSTVVLGGEQRGRNVSNKLRKPPPAKKTETSRRVGHERARKVSSASVRRSPVRSPSVRSQSPVKRARTMSFGYLSRMRLRLRRRSDAKQTRTQTPQAKAPFPETIKREVIVKPVGMEGYLVEPFGGDVRPTSYLSTTTVQTFYTARGEVSPIPESRPMSVTSVESAYTYTNVHMHPPGVGSEEGGRGRRMSVTFEDEERVLRQLSAHSMAHDLPRCTHNGSHPTTTAPAALMTSVASSTSPTTNIHHKAHHPTRPPPFPTTSARDSTGSMSSGAMVSTATSATSCTSAGWRSSAGSTPPTSPDASDASGCCGQAQPHSYESYYSHEKNVEEAVGRDRAQSDTGHASTSANSPRKGKLTKKRPTTASSSGTDMPGHEKTRPSADNNAVPGPSRTRSILGLRIGSTREKTREREGRLASVAEWTEGVEYLPQMRPPSPLWAGVSGTIPSPYSRLPLPSSCLSDNHFEDVNPTNALASLAFTGNSSALSSSALAALTSRLTHRASNEVLTASAASSVRGSSRRSKKAPPVDAPPWTAAFSVTPIEQGAKCSVEESSPGMFDPYAETHRDAKMQRPSMSFLHPLREKMLVQPAPQVSTPQSDTTVPRTRRESKRDNSPNTLRRWTLAMADVPDEVLVQELEKLRLEGATGTTNTRRRRRSKVVETSELGHADDWKIVGEESGSEYSGDERDPSPTSTSHHGSHSHSGSSSNHLHSAAHLSMLDDHEWKTARRALLCCRELVRTERNYQARLRILLSGDTSTPPPGLVLTYVPALLRASEALLSRLEDDPSAWGVSAAFVAVEEDVETAFVAWAGVVGEIFVGPTDIDPRERVGRKLTRASRNSSFSSVNEAAGKSLSKRSRSGASLAHPGMDSVYRKRGVSMIEPNPTPPSPLPSRPLSAANTMGMFTAALGTGLAYGISPSSVPTPTQDEFPRPRITAASNGSAGTLSRTFGAFKSKKNAFSSSPSLSPHASPVTPTFPFGKDEEREREKEREKKPGVRELAILPVQRVMRYVLQYRDLLENTPIESPSRGLVERALESATRIATKCDRAQDNSAFFLRRV